MPAGLTSQLRGADRRDNGHRTDHEGRGCAGRCWHRGHAVCGDSRPARPAERALRYRGHDRPRHEDLAARVVADERPHRLGIELNTGLLDEDVDCLLVMRWWPVRAGRGDRVEGVRDGDDPGSEWNLHAAKAIGVSGSVEAFMVMANDRGEFRVAQAGHHLGTLRAVALEDFELGGGQCARFHQDLARQTKLADVVHGGRPRDLGYLVWRQTELAGDDGGVASDAT